MWPLLVKDKVLKYEDKILLFVAFTPDITAAIFKRQNSSKNTPKILIVLK